MPKNSALGGPSYDGYVDVSPSDVSQPEWVAAVDVVDFAPDYEDELSEEPEPIELTTPSPTPRGRHETEV